MGWKKKQNLHWIRKKKVIFLHKIRSEDVVLHKTKCYRLVYLSFLPATNEKEDILKTLYENCAQERREVEIISLLKSQNYFQGLKKQNSHQAGWNFEMC